jgi:hypothetical protein
MGGRGHNRGCPSLAKAMQTLGMSISFGVFLLEGLLILRGARSRLYGIYPLFYSYIVYCFCGSLAMYLFYWLAPQIFPSAYWIYYLVCILAEFTVLVEFSDHIFRPFPAIRNLGRALTLAISITLGLAYILPAILGAVHRRPALLDFALRASVTKATILVVLFLCIRHYGSHLGRNVADLMFGFAIFLAVDITANAIGKAFSPALSANVVWVLPPLGSLLCVSVWTISLWDLVPVPGMQPSLAGTPSDSRAVALELHRLNSELSKFMRK